MQITSSLIWNLHIPIVGEAGVDSFECIFIQKAQQEVYASCKTDSVGWYALPELSDIIDITGDKIPDLVITEYTGGASCCWGFNLFRLGERFKYVQWLDNGKAEVSRFSFPKENGAIAVIDSTYAYWEGPGYDGPSLFYAQTPVGDHFEVELESLTGRPFSKADFANALAEIKKEMSYDSTLPNSELRRHVIELATSGHLIHALDIAKAVWPLAENTLTTFDLFLAAIANAPYESRFFREYVFTKFVELDPYKPRIMCWSFPPVLRWNRRKTRTPGNIYPASEPRPIPIISAMQPVVLRIAYRSAIEPKSG